MIFVSIEDFYEKASSCYPMTRQEEIECAQKMNNGDPVARERLIQSYTPMVAGYIKRTNPDMQNLTLALYCMQALEKAVDSFDFLHSREPFSRHLSLWLRHAVTGYLAR